MAATALCHLVVAERARPLLPRPRGARPASATRAVTCLSSETGGKRLPAARSAGETCSARLRRGGEHPVRDLARVRHQRAQAHAGEDEGVVPLADAHGPAARRDRLERAAGGDQGPPAGPGQEVRGRAPRPGWSGSTAGRSRAVDVRAAIARTTSSRERPGGARHARSSTVGSERADHGRQVPPPAGDGPARRASRAARPRPRGTSSPPGPSITTARGTSRSATARGERLAREAGRRASVGPEQPRDADSRPRPRPGSRRAGPRSGVPLRPARPRGPPPAPPRPCPGCRR